MAVRYLTQRYIGDYDPNIEDTYTKLESVDGQHVLVRIMDTCDQHCDLTPDRYLTWADCILLVFSITSSASFEALTDYLEAWTNYRASLPPPPPPPPASRAPSRRASSWDGRDESKHLTESEKTKLAARREQF
jgi:Ras-like protein family protein 12